MSRVCGSVQVLGVPFQIGPDANQPPSSHNTWSGTLATTPADQHEVRRPALPERVPTGLEVDVGYGTDVFTGTDRPDFSTQPANVKLVGMSVRDRSSSTVRGRSPCSRSPLGRPSLDTRRKKP